MPLLCFVARLQKIFPPYSASQIAFDFHHYTSLAENKNVRFDWGDVAALARSHMNGSLPFEKTIEQTI